jgi:hypothetical protein
MSPTTHYSPYPLVFSVHMHAGIDDDDDEDADLVMTPPQSGGNNGKARSRYD